MSPLAPLAACPANKTRSAIPRLPPHFASGNRGAAFRRQNSACEIRGAHSSPTSLGHHLSGAMDLAPDSRISPTAANVAGQRLVDVLVRRIRNFFEEHRCAHNLSRLAIPALRHVYFKPGALQGMAQAGRESLDSGDFFSCSPRYRSHTRAHRLAINMDRAGSALSHTTAVLGPGQFQVLAQDPKQRSGGINIHIYATFIYAERNHWENLLWQKLSWLRSWLSSVTEQMLPRTSEKQQKNCTPSMLSCGPQSAT